MSGLLDMLGSKYPIIQGPIGALNSARQVAAVAEAGGFGMLALGFVSNVDEVKRMVEEVRSLTDKPFGANIMLLNPLCPEIVKVLADYGIKTIATSTGSPKKIYPLIHELGMKGIHSVLSLHHAVRAAESGADALVVSGSEAGGLRSTGPELSTMILVPLVVENVDVPVVAAGGIADSRGYRAALALGAQGVEIGTRFIASEESPAPREWKELIVKAGDGSTTLISLGNMMMRVIMHPSFDASKNYNLLEAMEGWTTPNFDLFPAGGGQVSALIKEIKPIKEIIEEMVSS